MEFKDIKNLRGTKRKEIRLNMLDTLLFLNNVYGFALDNQYNIVFLLVRKMAKSEITSYHVRAKAGMYTLAYLKCIKDLSGVEVMELK